MQALTFRDTQFDITDHNGQPWLQGAQIASALGYASEDAVSRIYRRNADEFTPCMTETVKLTVSGNLQKEVRIFSLRGAHLLAMFARTEVAKEFRRWVLDVLDGLSAQDSAPAGAAMPAEPIHLTYNDRPFRIIPEDAALWFVAADVAHALDMRDAYRITRHLRSEHKSHRQVGRQRLNVIDRRGLDLALLHGRPERTEPLCMWLDAALEQFVTGVAPRALLGGLSGEQQNTLKTLVKARVEALPKERQAKAAVTCWSALKSKFGCSYKEIAQEHFTEAVSLVARVVLEGEWLGAATTSFAGLIGQPLKRGERWLVSLDAQGREHFEPVPYDACVMTHQELLQAMVTPGELPVSTEEMFELAMSALVNLKARSDFQARRLAGLKPAQPPV